MVERSVATGSSTYCVVHMLGMHFFLDNMAAFLRKEYRFVTSPSCHVFVYVCVCIALI
jgi:hypothetical protein